MIYIEGEEFRAPKDVPYAEELRQRGWVLRLNDHWFTLDVENVIPFVEHLEPEIQQTIFAVNDAYEASKAVDTDFQVETPEGMQLEPFQRVDVKLILERDDILLAEECGTGKTPIMIVALNMLRVRRALIICPAVAKYNWLLNEWPRWSILNDRSIGVAEGSAWPDTDIVIINYDILDRHKKRIQNVTWDVLIADESHRANNKDARRTTMILGGLLRVRKHKNDPRTLADIATTYCAEPTQRKTHYTVPAIKAKKRIFATGTPFNRPKNLWAICEAFDPQGLGSNWDDFHRRYCQGHINQLNRWDIDGAAYREELGVRLRAKFMIRHDAEVVLKLPPQERHFYILPPVDFVLEAEDVFLRDNMDALIELGDMLGHPVDENSSREAFMKIVGEAIIENVVKLGDPKFSAMFTQFAAIRKQTGIAKLPHIIDYVKLKSDDGTIPTCVYGYHRDVMAGLKEAFPDSSYVIGGMTSVLRNQEVKRFQDGEVNLFLGNLDAAGENITLTRANYMIVAELDWRGTQLKQVFMRIRRYTQKRASRVDILCAAHSFDSLLAENAFTKIRNIDTTLDA